MNNKAKFFLPCYIFGPFFGEASWEYFRFAPYAIHLKKENPKHKLIVFTRPSRFDFYGQYSDILVPLFIENDNLGKQRAFTFTDITETYCKRVADQIRITYKNRFDDIRHFYPDISALRYNLKWQFPRDKMNYDFIPRKPNSKLMDSLVYNTRLVIVDSGYEFKTKEYRVIHIDDFKYNLENKVDDKNLTYYGCLIELIKRSLFVVSDLTSDVGRLALLLKTPLIYPNRKISNDAVHLFNPLKTTVIDCENIQDGVIVYENIV
jgi:hypothetical protein